MKRIFILCTIVMSCAPIFAQNKIHGKITDQDQAPLDGAAIYIPELNKGTISDEKGFFELKDLPNGRFKVQFTYIGHNNKVETIQLDHSDLELNELLTATSIEAEEIVVTGGYNATQHENATKIEVLKLNPLENKVTHNLSELLTQVPGVDMISKGSGISKPVIRGLSMNDILVLNNGVRYENYQYSSHHPLGIDEFGIEDVEIIKGPASLLYGSDAIGGVLNFLREKPAAAHTFTGDYNLRLFSNSLGYTNNLGLKGSNGKVFAGIRVGQTNNADYLMGGGDFVPNSRSQEYSLKANAGVLTQKGTFKLFYDYNQENLGLVEDEPVTLITSRGRDCSIYYQQFNTHLLSLQNKLYLGNYKLDVNAAYQHTDLTHFAEKGVYEIQMGLGTWTYETRLYLPSDKNSEYIIGFQGMNQINTNLNNRETKLLPNANISSYSAFGMLQHTFIEKLKVQTGLRYDYKLLDSKTVGISGEEGYRAPVNKDYGSFSGSLGATYPLNDQLLVRANLASAYRTPNLAELTSNGQHETRYEVGDNQLVPEKSWESDLSLHYHARNLTFDLAIFYNHINHYIYISPTGDTTVSGIPIYKYMQNNSELYGLESGFHFHPESMRWMHFQTTYAYVIGRQDNGNYLPFIPAHKLDFELRAEKQQWLGSEKLFISLNTHTAFDQDNTAPDETSTSGYTLLDGSLGGEWHAGHQTINLVLSISNILDKKYIDHLSTLKEVNMYNPGRNISLALKIPFSLITHPNNLEK